MFKRLCLSGWLFVWLVVTLLLLPPTLDAASSTKTAYKNSRYYDFGPYYRQNQVLGLTFSSLENLTIPQTPADAIIPSSSGVLPGNFFYPFEKFVENTQLAFTFDPVQKEEMRLGFAQERLSEAKTLIDQGQPNLATSAIDGYQYAMNTLSENISSLAKTNSSQVTNFLDVVEKTAASNMIAASNLTLSLPPATANTFKEVVDASQKSLDTVADATAKPSIPNELSVSIQNLKEQGILTPEQSDRLYALDSRGEVREELEKLTASGQFPLSEVIKLDQAVTTQYPDAYTQTVDAYRLAELRSYQTLPPPSDDILTEVEKWQDQPVGTVPPNDIKPYLYYIRAEELAKTVNLTNFESNQQAEVAKFYPRAVLDNPTFSPSPSPSPQPSPTPGSSPQGPSPSPTDVASPQPSATPIPPNANLYLNPPSGSLPGDPTYFFKRLAEEAALAFTFDQAGKIEANLHLAEERLREANAIAADKNKQDVYETTLKLYQDTINSASSALKNLSGDESASKELAKELETKTAFHEIIFEKSLLPPSKDPKVITETIKASQDAMDRSADVLDRPALPPLLSSRLQDMKAQGLILPEEVDNLTKANSREEVREEIRKLTELGTFPPADAKKLDEAQNLTSPKDYNQLVEVRKIEELQNLRAVQAEFAQVATLRSNSASYNQRVESLVNTIDTSLIKPEDLSGYPALNGLYQNLVATASARPINGGQFGAEATPGAKLAEVSPQRKDAAVTTCPVGAVFKQFEGCMWENNGKRINDYDQYKCEGSGQYWSFAAGKCIAYEPGSGYKEDTKPLCPLGYTWNWQSQSCQALTGGANLLPSPKPEPSPRDDKEIEERSKSCPAESTYQVPEGCVWDKNGKSIHDQSQYKCARGQYFSFESFSCVANPKSGDGYNEGVIPACKQPNTTWSWYDGKCLPIPDAPIVSPTTTELVPPSVSFVPPDSPFYFFKQATEAIQNATAFTAQGKQEVRLAHARERFAESYYSLNKNDEDGFKKALASYTAKMQEIYNDLSKDINISTDSKKALGEKLEQYSVEQNLLLQKATVLASDDLNSQISGAVSITIQGIDRAADLKGEPTIPDDLKTTIESLPEKMLSDEEKKKILAIHDHVEARIRLNDLVLKGAVTQQEIAFIDKPLTDADPGGLTKLQELKKLDEIATLTKKAEENQEKVQKTEEIAQKLDEFRKEFEPGKEIPSEIRPYVRLIRIDEVIKTIRPDIVELSDFGNRKDLQLAIATLREEFKPTQESFKQLEDFKKNNPGKLLPFELARIEALAYGLGVRSEASSCFLPSPPFGPNTPCPPPGAPLPVASYYSNNTYGPTPFPSGIYSVNTFTTSTDKDGNPLVYGKGPTPTGAGVCPQDYHWMYDSGGWCMSNGGSYNNSYSGTSYNSSGASGFTPYSPYYSAPGVPPGSYGYQGPGVYSSTGPYAAPTYYGTAPTYYSTYPPTGTVPGSGPAPTASGECPKGFHWMPPTVGQNGWCMADAGTYTPNGLGTGTTPSSGIYYSPNLTKESCGPGYYWDGRGCIPTYGGGGSGSGTPWCWSAFPPPEGWSCGSGSSWDQSSCSCKPSGSYSGGGSAPSSYQYGCTPGYYWDGSKCVAGSYEGSGWSDTAARSQSWCQPPSGGCGSNSYWDYGSCYCRSSSTYSGGSGPSPSNQCQGLSCGGGAWLDYSTCSCKYSGGSGTSSTGSTITCYPPSAGCPGGWYDYGTCSCKTSSSSGGSSSGSCPSGSHWMSDNGGYCMSDNTSSGSSGGGSSSGSCPSGYHWMSDNGGWCMSDSSSSGTSPSSTPSTSTTTTTEPSSSTTSTPPASSEPAPATTESAPPPSSAPASSEPAPAPSP